MKYFYIKFISQAHPVNVYQLAESVWLSKGAREEITDSSGKLYMDSCYFIMRINNKDEESGFLIKFKEFIVLYSFIFNDSYPILYYEAGMFSGVKVQEANSFEELEKLLNENIKTRPQYPIDFRNIGKSNYIFSHFSDKHPFLYFYEIFQNLDKESKDLLYLFIFNPKNRNSNNEIYKTNYLKIALKYVIVEKILCHKKRLPCASVIEKCDKCERTNISHDKISFNQLIKTELKKIVSDGDTEKEYMDYIEMAKEIRDKYFHVGIMDEATYISDDTLPGETTIYDLEKTKKYKANAASLMNLDIQIADISRYLLFEELFNVKCYPKLRMLRSTCLILGNGNKS